jgi:hypothetical protein
MRDEHILFRSTAAAGFKTPPPKPQHSLFVGDPIYDPTVELEEVLRNFRFDASTPQHIRTKSAFWRGFFSEPIDPDDRLPDSPLRPRRMEGDGRTRNLHSYSVLGPVPGWASIKSKIQFGLKFKPNHDPKFRFIQNGDDALCALHTAAQVMYSCFWGKCESKEQIPPGDITQGVWGKRMLNALLAGGSKAGEFPQGTPTTILPANKPFEDLFVRLYKNERALDEGIERGRIARGERPRPLAQAAEDYIPMSFKDIFVAFFNLFTTDTMYTSFIEIPHPYDGKQNEYERNDARFVMANRPGPIDIKTDKLALSIHTKLDDIKFVHYSVTGHFATVLRVQHAGMSHFISYCDMVNGPLWFDPSPNTMGYTPEGAKTLKLTDFDTIEDVYYVLSIQPNPPQ